MSKVVGFQSGHDVSYCILENGVPVIHEELERFTREKEPLGDGLEMFFQRNTDVDDIPYFCSGNPGGRGGKWKDKCGKPEYFEQMQNIVQKNSGDYYVIGHHQSHAAGAFYSSNFSNALIITIDAGGADKVDPNDYSEPTSDKKVDTGFTVWSGNDTLIERVAYLNIHKFSIGFLWHKATERIFGLSVSHPKGNQAGTVMAMGTIGNPDKYFDVFYGNIVAEPSINWKHYKALAAKSEQEAFDIAAGLQKATEVAFREMITPYIDQYDGDSLCLSGGVTLNCVMTGKIFDWFPKIKHIHCDPIPYDGGLSLGSARYVWHHILGNPRIKWDGNASPYLGCLYTRDDIDTAISKFANQLNITTASDDHVIDLLKNSQGNVISVYGGGSESGRRALGNRSILADPRNSKMKDIINEKVKHRQWFRPFAPSILREDVSDWFVKDINSPYMSFIVKFRDDVVDKIPAVVHLDGTGRLQTVVEGSNKWYYNFINKFKEQTGVPILLNTSFNDREPIVETPEHAINCFLGTNIDYLYFYEYNILISKSK